MVGAFHGHIAPGEGIGERRQAVRKNVSWPARLEVGDGWVECQVINLSPTGAKVRIQGPLTGTNQVRLSIDHLGLFVGKVIWQSKSYIGVQFSRLPAAKGADPISPPRVMSVDEPVAAPDPLEPLLRDPGVSAILVNGRGEIHAERRGTLEPLDATAAGDLAARLAERAGLRLAGAMPVASGRLEDGSRITIVLPPVARTGPVVAIRKPLASAAALGHLVEAGTLSAAPALLLKIAVECRLNILIAGPAGAGKTTLLEALARLAPPEERIVAVEQRAELRLPQSHFISLEMPQESGRLGELVEAARRLRPDRIVLGDIEADAAGALIEAIQAGHDGVLAAIEAGSVPAALARFEDMLPPTMPARRRIASAFELILQLGRPRDGRYRLERVSEIMGDDGEAVATQDLFTREAGTGRFVPGDCRPRFLDKVEASGLAERVEQAMAASEQFGL